MVDKLIKYGLFAAMVAAWLLDALRKKRAGIKPDPERAKAILDKTASGVLGVEEKKPETSQ